MEEFFGFILSSDRTCEKNACSETYYLLKNVLGLEVILAKPVHNISGLSLVRITTDPIPILSKIEEVILNDQSILRYAHKLVPITHKIETNLNGIESLSRELSQKIQEHETWKISLRRRHSKYSRNEIIGIAAQEINVGKVELENPTWFLIIEVIGRWTYMSLSPKESISISKHRPDESDDYLSF